jgi:hypothetical protein
VLVAAEGAGAEGAAPQDSEADEDSDLMDEDGEAGACAICYALHLPDPTRPDELGEGEQLLSLTVFVVLVLYSAVCIHKLVNCMALFLQPYNRPIIKCMCACIQCSCKHLDCAACLLWQLTSDDNWSISLSL